jgi:hypothetical protein
MIRALAALVAAATIGLAPAASADTAQTPSPGPAPNGATALCCDGTYSFSQQPSGTCSHHDDVCQLVERHQLRQGQRA